MKIGFRLILFIICLNVVTGLVVGLNAPGTGLAFVPGHANATDMSEKFNSTEMIESASPEILSAIPFLGQIYTAFSVFLNAVNFVIAGFPTMLLAYANYIPDEGGRNAFETIAKGLIALFYFVIFAWVFQVLTGRDTE